MARPLQFFATEAPMPRDHQEPQSHGSEADRVTGRTVQPEWTDHVDVLQPISTGSELGDPARKVTSERGGAKRGGFFKGRDYR